MTTWYAANSKIMFSHFYYRNFRILHPLNALKHTERRGGGRSGRISVGEEKYKENKLNTDRVGEKEVERLAVVPIFQKILFYFEDFNSG